MWVDWSQALDTPPSRRPPGALAALVSLGGGQPAVMEFNTSVQKPIPKSTTAHCCQFLIVFLGRFREKAALKVLQWMKGHRHVPLPEYKKALVGLGGLSAPREPHNPHQLLAGSIM